MHRHAIHNCVSFTPPSLFPYPPPSSRPTWPEAAGAFKPDVSTYFDDYLRYILGVFHLLLTIWMIIEYFVVNYPNFILPLPGFFYKIFRR